MEVKGDVVGSPRGRILINYLTIAHLVHGYT